MVHAPERPDAGVRVRVRRRESAGARLGVLARLQDDGRARAARSRVPRARVPQAADQLHLVGESQGRRAASNLFSGGFLGLDNIGVFDRSKPLPDGGQLEQADGTAWMAFYCATMLSIALELASDDPSYEDIASKFFEHFVSITDAMNSLGGMGLWDEQDGFYYDVLNVDGTTMPLRIRSMVGIIPLFAVEILEQDVIDALPGFRSGWSGSSSIARPRAAHRAALQTRRGRRRAVRSIACWRFRRASGCVRVLRYVLDENEFLSPYGVRALSRFHQRASVRSSTCGGMEHRVDYTPGESTSGMFGGNSNWRGPIWFPVNYLLVEALERYHHFYGDTLQVECPTGSGQMMNLKQVAARDLGEADAALPAGRVGSAAVPRRRRALRRRSALARARVVPRVLPRRHGPGRRREPPDRLDGARRAPHRRRGAGARRPRARLKLCWRDGDQSTADEDAPAGLDPCRFSRRLCGERSGAGIVDVAAYRPRGRTGTSAAERGDRGLRPRRPPARDLRRRVGPRTPQRRLGLRSSHPRLERACHDRRKARAAPRRERDLRPQRTSDGDLGWAARGAASSTIPGASTSSD